MGQFLVINYIILGQSPNNDCLWENACIRIKTFTSKDEIPYQECHSLLDFVPTFFWCIWQGSHSSIKAGATFCDIICDGQGWNYLFQGSVTFFFKRKTKPCSHVVLSGGLKKNQKNILLNFFWTLLRSWTFELLSSQSIKWLKGIISFHSV